MAIAYTRIRKGAKVNETTGSAGQVGTIYEYDEVQVGEDVSQDDLGVDDETWESYYRDGVVGDEELPDDMEEGESLNRYRARKAVETLDSLQVNRGEQEVPKDMRPRGDVDDHGLAAARKQAEAEGRTEQQTGDEG